MNDEQLIKRGFNDGYMMEQNSPEYAEIIAKAFVSDTNPYAHAFVEGRNERIKFREVDKSLLNGGEKNSRENSIELDF